MAMIMTPKSKFTGEVAWQWSQLNLKTEELLRLINGDAFKDHPYHEEMCIYIRDVQRIYNNLLKEWQDAASELKEYRRDELCELRQQTTVVKQTQSTSPYIIANSTSGS